MSFTKIINSDTITIMLPGSLGGATLNAGESAVVPHDVGIVSSAMSNAGFFNYGLSPVQSSIDLNMDIYVNKITGDDNNDGTIDFPLATFDKAWNQMSIAGKSSVVRIFLSAGSFPIAGRYFTPFSSFGTLDPSLGFPIQIYGNLVDSGLGILTGDDTSDVQVYVAPTTTTTLDQFKGFFLRNTITGERACVVSSTFSGGKTTFNLGAVITSGEGQTFIIEESNTFLDFTDIDTTFLNAGPTPIGFQNLNFRIASGFSGHLLFPGTKASFNAVKLDFGDGFFNNLYFTFGAEVYFSTNPDGTGSGDSAGVYATSETIGGLFGNDQVQLRGYLTGNNVSFGFGSNMDIVLSSANMVWPFAPGFFSTDSLSHMAINSGKFDNGGISCFSKCYLFFGNMDVSNNAGGDAFLLAGAIWAEFQNVTGTGNDGYGINIQACTQVNRFSGGAGVAVTGTSGATLIGADVKSYVDLPFSEVDESGPTLNRII